MMKKAKTKTNSELSVEEIKAVAKERAIDPQSRKIKYDPITPNIRKIEMNDRSAGSVEGDTAYVSRVEFFSLLQAINHGRDIEPWVFAGSPKDQWEKLIKSPYFIDLLHDKPTRQNEVVLNRGQIDRVKKYFKRAIDKGYITFWDGRVHFFDHGHGHKGKGRELAWFIREVLSPNYDQIIPYSKIEALFGIRRLEVETSKLFDRVNTPAWEQDLYDKIFYD